MKKLTEFGGLKFCLVHYFRCLILLFLRDMNTGYFEVRFFSDLSRT
jgi:hypothetical protein